MSLKTSSASSSMTIAISSLATQMQRCSTHAILRPTMSLFSTKAVAQLHQLSHRTTQTNQGCSTLCLAGARGASGRRARHRLDLELGLGQIRPWARKGWVCSIALDDLERRRTRLLWLKRMAFKVRGCAIAAKQHCRTFTGRGSTYRIPTATTMPSVFFHASREQLSAEGIQWQRGEEGLRSCA